jgi:tetratricopeptide (TPR) repeat protein
MMFATLALATVALAAAPAKDAEKPAGGEGVLLADATFEPGKETRISDPSVGGVGYYVVWIPKEYAPDRTWPAVFCYHGVNQKPTTYPFQPLMGGKGFVVVGMCYAGGTGLEAYGAVSRDVENVKRLLPVLTQKLKLDTRQLFIGGFSMGGFMSSSIGECTASIWAGMAICGAGRGGGGGAKDPQGFRGKPVFAGAGEKCPYHGDAQKAADHYKSQGADVTFETWLGKGHTVDTKSKVFADWMWASGPLKQVVADVAEAKKLQAAGKLGLAYAKFSQAAGVPGDHAVCKEATAAAEAIGKEAEAKLAAADEAVKAKRYKEGAAALSQAAATYSGSKFGDQAAKSMAAIKGDPTIQGEVETARQNEQAAAIVKQAQAAEQAKDFAAAMKLYEQVLAACPKSELCASAKARLEALKGDKAVQAAIVAKDADRECRSWLSMADNFIKADDAEKAREYLKKIIDKYPDTDWGRQARERLQKVK